MPGPGNILIKVGADAGQAVRELSTVDRALGDTMSTTDKMGAGLKKAAMPAAAALGAIGFAALGAAKAAAEDAAAADKLAGVLERTTGATDAQVASTEEWLSKLSLATGVADDELRPALATIATSTKDVTKAQELMSDALDIAAASGKPVETVANALALAYQGQTSKLEKLVPGLSQAAKESDNFGTIMGELEKTTSGAAERAADAEPWRVLQNQFSELYESLGTSLLPVMDSLAGMLQTVADFASNNTTAIKILVAAIVGLSGTIVAINAVWKAYKAAMIAVELATKAYTAAQWLLNAALDANPIGIIIFALAGLATGLVIAYKRSETFREIVHAALNAVKAAANALAGAFSALLGAARSAFDWIVDHWKVALFAFGPIGAAVYVVVTNFDKLKAAAVGAFDAIKGAISSVAGAIESIISAVERLISALGRIKVPHIGLPDLPGPFSVPVPAAPGARGRAGAGTFAASTSSGITVNVYGALDPEGTARAIRRVLDRHERRNGRSL